MVIIRFLLVALIVFMVVTVAAFVYLQWWQALLVVAFMIVAFVVGLRIVIKSFGKMIGDAMVKAFEVKAQVLKGATAEVHAVQPALAPPPRAAVEDDDEEPSDEDEHDEGDEGDDEAEEDRNFAWYRIDFTLKPSESAAGPMEHWDVGDLCVVDFKAAPLSLDLHPRDDAPDPGEGFHFREVKVHQDGQLVQDDGGKYVGTQRLNVLVGVPPELRELKFRYYTEQFGRIVLPSATAR